MNKIIPNTSLTIIFLSNGVFPEVSWGHSVLLLFDQTIQKLLSKWCWITFEAGLPSQPRDPEQSKILERDKIDFLRMAEIKVQIVRFVDDYQPGFVECQFTDAIGKTWSIIEKVPVVSSENLTAASEYPQEGGVPCDVVERYFRNGRELALIITGNVEAVEAEVAASELYD